MNRHSISFCINTAKNEKNYIKLLIKSLKENTKLDQHEILVFVDSDNQNTYEELLELQKKVAVLKVCKNPNKYPIGSQRNVSVMFHNAKNDIVCYLQSDMVVGKDFDKHILENLTSNNVILSCARIEPPLHPESPEKIVKDFGSIPEEFNYVAFNKFVEELQAENRPNIDGHFAPFAVFKSTWFGILGGFDTQFRCSREDSDTIIRMKANNLETIQTWNACVYHFTCVSSRGKDWFKQDAEANYKNALQQRADIQELKRFIRKWGYFGHHTKPVYNIAFNIEVDGFVDFNYLKWIEPYCYRMYLSEQSVVKHLIEQTEFDAHYYSNLRLGYPLDYWEKVKPLFNPIDFTKKILINNEKFVESEDIVISFTYSSLFNNFTEQQKYFIESIQDVINSTEKGVYEYGPFSINIKRKLDISSSYNRFGDVDFLLKSEEFVFV